ncbi:MAG TPA: MFS transporter [Acidimicrobiales bacterium]|nr:MFS transporter [Acidimicrobiales bacterium]
MAPKGSPGSSGQGREGGTERHWWTLLAVCGATFMLLVDITIVQVALPTMQRSLHATFSDLQWVISAYALSLAALILTQGALADKFGRKRIFIFGLAVFTLASAACGLSHTPAELIASRAVQGVGGAAMFATSLALIGQDFQGKARSSAIAVWGATVGGAVAIGPLVGGALTSAFGWQWIFYVNVPVGVLTLLVSMRMVNVADPNAGRLDWNGLLTFSGGLFLLILGLTRGNDDGWSSRKVVVTLSAAVLLLVLFVIVELLQKRPMFDLSLFRKPSFTGVSVATFCIGAGMFALLPYLTLYLQNDLGLSPLQGGERLLPLTTLSFLVPLLSRPVTERVPAGLALCVGLATSAVGIWLFTGLTVGSSWRALLPGLLVSGVGVGLANPAIAKIALGVVPPQRAGMASGISNTFRIGGVATGVAALGAVFQHRLQSTLHGLVGAHLAPGLARAVAAGGTAAAARASGGQPTVVAAAHHAFVNGIDEVVWVGAVTVAVGAAFAALVRRKDFYSRRREGYRPPAAPPLPPPPLERDLVPEAVG